VLSSLPFLSTCSVTIQFSLLSGYWLEDGQIVRLSFYSIKGVKIPLGLESQGAASLTDLLVALFVSVCISSQTSQGE
jgi:hypothetical protein